MATPAERLREDFVHYYTRKALSRAGWRLVAGQYPKGSDDELPCLNVVDPELARDLSPDHRRHSYNKLVPDLIAHRSSDLLVIEMKPVFDKADEEKLVVLRDERRADFNRALDKLVADRDLDLPPAETLKLVPTLGFCDGCAYPPRREFCYLLVRADGSVHAEGAPSATGPVL